MPIIIGHRGGVGVITSTLARLETLVSDLGCFISGGMPTARELDAATLLNPFTSGTRTLPSLVGGNSGHPILKSRVIKTSEVWIIAPDFGWLRTYSRLYRLGEPDHLGGQS